MSVAGALGRAALSHRADRRPAPSLVTDGGRRCSTVRAAWKRSLASASSDSARWGPASRRCCWRAAARSSAAMSTTRRSSVRARASRRASRGASRKGLRSEDERDAALARLTLATDLARARRLRARDRGDRRGARRQARAVRRARRHLRRATRCSRPTPPRISVTAIAAASARPERCLGLHFFNPAPLMPLVEVGARRAHRRGVLRGGLRAHRALRQAGRALQRHARLRRQPPARARAQRRRARARRDRRRPSPRSTPR